VFLPVAGVPDENAENTSVSKLCAKLWTMRRISQALLLVMLPASFGLVDAQTASVGAPKSLAEWRAMAAALEDTIETEFPNFREVAKQHAAGIVRVADVIGDGIPVALVYLGTGGAYTDELCVMRFSDGKPAVALFKDRAGKLSELTFAEGASVMNRVSIELLPEEHSVYSMESGYGNSGKLSRCTGQAYKWNGRSQLFEFNLSLTKRMTRKKCAELPQKLEQ